MNKFRYNVVRRNNLKNIISQIISPRSLIFLLESTAQRFSYLCLKSADRVSSRCHCLGERIFLQYTDNSHTSQFLCLACRSLCFASACEVRKIGRAWICIASRRI